MHMLQDPEAQHNTHPCHCCHPGDFQEMQYYISKDRQEEVDKRAYIYINKAELKILTKTRNALKPELKHTIPQCTFKI